MKLTPAFSFIIFILLAGKMAYASDASRSLSDLLDLEANGDDINFVQKTPSTLRIKIIREAAYSIGSQHGLYWQMDILKNRISDLEEGFDNVYSAPLKSLMIKYKNYYIVPPVINSTNGGMRKNDNGRVLRIAQQTYRIIQDPYFVINPPSWRDYFILNSPVPHKVNQALLPNTDEEQSVWRKAVNKGWRAGIAQANSILQTQVARITRDIIGMVNFHLLRAKNMISEPEVIARYFPVTGGGREMSIRDSIIKIKSDPTLNANRLSWRALPRLPDASKLFPHAYRLYQGGK